MSLITLAATQCCITVWLTGKTSHFDARILVVNAPSWNLNDLNVVLILIRSGYANLIDTVPTKRCRYGDGILVVVKKYDNRINRNKNVIISYRQYDHHYDAVKIHWLTGSKRQIHQGLRIVVNRVANEVCVTHALVGRALILVLRWAWRWTNSDWSTLLS